ncbi:hypothetical protein GY26_16030 [Gammaproteobacteria bacterium MFB021]|nr:hypothetical protein GY26_16030 [Gammaproteobacteria bacterium MFB021]
MSRTKGGAYIMRQGSLDTKQAAPEEPKAQDFAARKRQEDKKRSKLASPNTKTASGDAAKPKE